MLYTLHLRKSKLARFNFLHRNKGSSPTIAKPGRQNYLEGITDHFQRSFSAAHQWIQRFLRQSAAFVLRVKLPVPEQNSLFSSQFAFESENLLCSFFWKTEEALLLGIGSKTVVLENKTCNSENREVIEVVSAFLTCAAALESCLH